MLARIALALSLALPQNGPAPVAPYLVNSIAGSSPHATTITLSLPTTSLAPAMCSYIAFVAWTASDVTELGSIPAPLGWSEIGSIENGATKLSAYAAAYGDSSVSFVSSQPCNKFEIYIGLWTNIDITAPMPLSSNMGLGIEHIVGGINAPADDALCLSAWMSPDTPAMFQPALYTTQIAFSGISRASTGSAGLCVAYSIVPIGSTGPVGAQSFNADSMSPYFVNALGLTVGVKKL